MCWNCKNLYYIDGQARCELDYRELSLLGGDIERYNKLINEAMRISNIITCPCCNNAMVEGKKGKTKGKILLCTKCGYIEKQKGEKVC